jgi:uncharacterized protein (TIGR04141 family)
VSVDTRRFFLMDGGWFAIGADYVRASRDAIAPLLRRAERCPAALVTVEGRAENDYNR